jgi:hypothetical protein
MFSSLCKYKYGEAPHSHSCCDYGACLSTAFVDRFCRPLFDLSHGNKRAEGDETAPSKDRRHTRHRKKRLDSPWRSRRDVSSARPFGVASSSTMWKPSIFPVSIRSHLTKAKSKLRKLVGSRRGTTQSGSHCVPHANVGTEGSGATTRTPKGGCGGVSAARTLCHMEFTAREDESTLLSAEGKLPSCRASRGLQRDPSLGNSTGKRFFFSHVVQPLRSLLPESN